MAIHVDHETYGTNHRDRQTDVKRANYTFSALHIEDRVTKMSITLFQCLDRTNHPTVISLFNKANIQKS